MAKCSERAGNGPVKWNWKGRLSCFGRLATVAALTVTMTTPTLFAGEIAYAETLNQDAVAAQAASGSTNDEDPYRHGTVQIDADAAKDGIITLKKGQTATIKVSPYIHKQYKGCGKTDCPENCEAEHGVECFVKGMGCKCDKNPVDRQAKVTTTIDKQDVVKAGDVAADENWSNTNTDLTQDEGYVTKNGTITLTAESVGTAQVTVAAETDENGNINNASGNTSTLLEHWHPATKTYTVKVVDDSTDTSQPSIEGLESEHNYADNFDNAWEYVWDDAAVYGMAVTFDEKTEVENNYDFITVKNFEGETVGKYTGKELAGKTIYVPQSKGFKIELTSDQSGNKWGFKVAKVERLTENNLEKIATIDPISPVFLDKGTTPAPTVHYGTKVLEAGKDYKVSYTDNDKVGEATLTVTGIGEYTGVKAIKYQVVDADHLADGTSVKKNQTVVLRQSGDEGSASVSLSGASQEWAQAVTGITVKSLDGDDKGAVQELDSSQYKINVASGRVTFARTEDAPIFSVAVGEGDPITVSGRWGDTTYNQSKKYLVTIKASGYQDATAEVTFATGASDAFSIVVDEDGNDKTTDDQTVVKTYTKDEIEDMSTFQNGSSQCGMTGFRTFSATGVALADLIEDAGVEVSAKDAFKLDTTDDFGRTWTYSQLFGDRYFLQSIYTDQDVKDTYAKLVKSDDEAGATIELRKLLASKALEENSIAKPMISANYVETMIGADEVATAQLPTEENTHVNSLVGQENQYRFTYGIALVKEDHKVTFNTNGGSEVAAQTVQSNLMTSTENTTIRSTYWNNSLVIYKNAAEEPAEDTNPEKLTVPENPTREGYTFAGWYTKDGTETGDWGEKFDFTANNGTVDQDTQLYAKWHANSETVSQAGETAQAYREAQYGEPPAGDTSNAGQHVKVTVAFDGPVAVTDEAALIKSLKFSVIGGDNTTLTATADGNNLVLDVQLGFALMAGTLNVSAVSEDGVLEGITVDGKSVKLDKIKTSVDTGLTFEAVSAVKGTKDTPASTTYKVTHGANVRSMNHIVWLTNNGKGAKGSSILANAADYSQSTTAHHHMWFKFTALDSANSIVSNASESLDAAGYTVTDNGDGTFTITAKTAKQGEILGAANYTDSFFNETGLKLGDDVEDVALPTDAISYDLGMSFPEKASQVSTSMGRYHGGKTTFSLTPSADALASYQETHEGADAKSMLNDWISNITSVTIDGTTLEGEAFDEWKDQLTNATDDAGKLNYYELTAGGKSATLTLPIALFDTAQEKSTKNVVIESKGFSTVSGDVTFRSLNSNEVVVRILSADGSKVEKTTTLTMDQLKKLPVQSGYTTAANCGMAGLRTYYSEGVLLTDVLKAAGVNFNSGMTLKVRVNDQLQSNGNGTTTEDGYWSQSTWTYDELMGTARYYYPSMWDNTTKYDELGGKTIYEVLSENKNAWKGDDEQAQFLRKKLAETEQQVSPILAWSWNESVPYFGGTNPTGSYDGYSQQLGMRFLYGLKADANGIPVDDNTTFANTYGVFGIDILGGEAISTDNGNGGDHNNGSNGNNGNQGNGGQATPGDTKPASVVAKKSADKSVLANTGDRTFAIAGMCALAGMVVIGIAVALRRKNAR